MLHPEKCDRSLSESKGVREIAEASDEQSKLVLAVYATRKIIVLVLGHVHIPYMYYCPYYMISTCTAISIPYTRYTIYMYI